MALRRPPTRVELKTEDIEEYHQVHKRFLPFQFFVKPFKNYSLIVSRNILLVQVRREKEMEMQDSNASTPTAAFAAGMARGITKATSAMERKQEAQERIGITRQRPP
jgi:Anaphase-promoting complex APC subunit CDC26